MLSNLAFCVSYQSIAAPDVTVINNEFRVERVDLQALTVDLSFPVRTYTQFLECVNILSIIVVMCCTR